MTAAAPPNGKILAFDLETADLSANRGHIICAAAKWVGEKKFYTWRIDDAPGYGKTPRSFFNDKHIVAGLIPLLEEADAVVAHYGAGFDVPYVNTRAVVNKLTPPAPFTLIDTCLISRSRFKLARNDLGSLGALYGTKGKWHLPWKDWEVARYGSRRAISSLLKYNKNDVDEVEEIYLKMRPVMLHHPYIGPIIAGVVKTRCPACGGGRSKDHGVRRTKTFEVFRRRCERCGTAFESHRRKIAA